MVIGSMAANTEEEAYMSPTSPRLQQTTEKTTATATSTWYMLILSIMSNRRTWVFIFVLVYSIVLTFSWNFLKSLLLWYKSQAQPSTTSSGWPALYASVLLGAVFGVLSMIAALAVMVPAILVTWITIVVLLAFFGKSRRVLVVEGRKITKEIFGFVMKTLLKEGNLVAAACAVLGYFALARRTAESD